MPVFLLEIGVEEIPAGMIAAAQADLAERVEKLLRRERIAADDLRVTSYSTPRRLAAIAEGVQPSQADVEEEVVGPSTKVAYKDGVPTPAAIAFAKKFGVEASALRTIQNAKGEYVAATVRRQGRAAVDVLTAELPREIGAIAWPKNMVWRAGKPERFVRPVRWLVALLDKEILPVEFAGVVADRVTYGHRVLHGDVPVVIHAPREYVEKLASTFVAVEPDARKHHIRKALDAAARTIPGARWREDEALVETVTNLTEWPSVIVGNFDESYLALPQEILITVMRDHQKYFALEDANGKLLPNFLAVLNIEVDATGAAIIRHGNERVLRARFNDARFFWDQDQKISLADRVEMLKHVTFHKDLGSYWDKTRRNELVVTELQARIGLPSNDSFISDMFRAVIHAARLAKTDLTTEMVKEFPELQGVVGGLYLKKQRARGILGPNSGFHDREFFANTENINEVADAIYDHYKPTSSSDSLPRTRTGCVLAMADKISTVIDMFAVGEQPTGSKDPFALRRAGNGFVRILVEKGEIGGERLHLATFYNAGIQDSRIQNNPPTQALVYEFLLDRFEYYLQESKRVRLQVSRAVRNSEIARRDHANSANRVGFSYVAGFATALNEQVGSPNVISVAELLKRTSNILRQAREKKIAYAFHEEPLLLKDAPEIALSHAVDKADEKIQQNYRGGNYSEMIAAIAALQQPLNAFFDHVMVMVDDEKLRANRLALLARTEATVRWAADFSELASIQ
jgi:glycyl-tRNA synthetase beta chain